MLWNLGPIIYYGDDSGSGGTSDSDTEATTEATTNDNTYGLSADDDSDTYTGATYDSEGNQTSQGTSVDNTQEGNTSTDTIDTAGESDPISQEPQKNPDGTNYGEPDSFGRFPTDPGYGTTEETNPGTGGNAGYGNTPIGELQEKIDDLEVPSVDTTITPGEQAIIDAVTGILNGQGLVGGILPDATPEQIAEGLGLIGDVTQPVSYFNPDGSPGESGDPYEAEPDTAGESDQPEPPVETPTTTDTTTTSATSGNWQNPDLTAIQPYLDQLQGVATETGYRANDYDQKAFDLLNRYGLSMGANAGETLDLATAAANRNAKSTAGTNAKEAARQMILAAKSAGLNAGQAGIAAGRETGGAYNEVLTSLFPELMKQYQTAAESLSSAANDAGQLSVLNQGQQTDAINSMLSGTQNEQQLALNELLGKMGVNIDQQALDQQSQGNTLNLIGTLLAGLGLLV